MHPTPVFDIFNQFATDPNKELEGVWTPIGAPLRLKEDGKTPDPDSAPAVLVARANNKRYTRLLVSEYEANKTILDRKDDFADQRNEQIMIDIAARSILLGWKNFHFNGRQLPDGWSIEDAKELLAVKDFRELVGRLSADQSKYLIVQADETAKN